DVFYNQVDALENGDLGIFFEATFYKIDWNYFDTYFQGRRLKVFILNMQKVFVEARQELVRRFKAHALYESGLRFFQQDRDLLEEILEWIFIIQELVCKILHSCLRDMFFTQ